jgi:hypothetical protein
MVLRDEAPAELAEFRQHGSNLIIGQMLQDLPHEANITIRKRVLDHVGVPERDIGGAERRLIVRDQRFDDIHPDLAAAGRRKLPTHRVISAPQIDHGHGCRTDPAEFCGDLGNIGRDNRSLM